MEDTGHWCFDSGGMNTLVCKDNFENEEHLGQEGREQFRVYTRNSGLGTYTRFVVISLIALAALLLIVDVVLAVKYTKLKDTSFPLSDEDSINIEQNTPQVSYRATNESTLMVQKKLDIEKKRQTETSWEYDHQAKRSKELEITMDKISKETSNLRQYLPHIRDGCKNCPPNWLLMNSKCVFFSFRDIFGYKSFQRARQFCQIFGGDLLKMDSQDQQNATVKYLVNHIDGKTSGFWFGLREPDDEGIWKWMDGTILTEGYWMAGEPNDEGLTEDCAAVYPQLNIFQAWNDLPCSMQLGWICEKEIVHE